MYTYIPVSLVQERMAICKSRLDEIGRALGSELEKPMHRRNPLVLTFLESQRQKFDFSMATLSELLDAAGEAGPSIGTRPE